MYSLEDVGLCAEAGWISAAVSFQVGFKHVAESGHQLLEVARSHTQRAWSKDAWTLRLVVQEFTLRRTQTALMTIRHSDTSSQIYSVCVSEVSEPFSSTEEPK